MDSFITVSFQIEKEDSEKMKKIAEKEKLPDEVAPNVSRFYRQAVKSFVKQKSKSGGTIVEYAMVTAMVAFIGLMMLKLFVIWIYSMF